MIIILYFTFNFDLPKALMTIQTNPTSKILA